MGKYIKTFNYHSEYGNFANRGGMDTPNTSYCIDNNHVHYMPKQHYLIAYDANGNELTKFIVEFIDISEAAIENGYRCIKYYNDKWVNRGSFPLYAYESTIDSIEVDFYLGADNVSVTCGCQAITFNWAFNNNKVSITDITGFDNESCNGIYINITYSLNGINYTTQIAFEEREA